MEGFQPSAECGADTTVTYATAKFTQVSFTGNVASDRGGAVHVAAGSLEMDVSSPAEPAVLAGCWAPVLVGLLGLLCGLLGCWAAMAGHLCCVA